MSWGTEERERRRRRFMAAARGLTTWQAGVVMSRATPGINWRGSSKAAIAEAYAEGEKYHTTIPEGVIADLEAEVAGLLAAKPWGLQLTIQGQISWWVGPGRVRNWGPPQKAARFATTTAAWAAWASHQLARAHVSGRAGMVIAEKLPK